MLKKLSNRGELAVGAAIDSAAQRYAARIYRKTRVADVLDISQLAQPDLRRYALMAHFDFVVADNDESPLFAMEFDGAGHDSVNDAKKDAICSYARLPLFRIDVSTSQMETTRQKFVSYLVHLWFLTGFFQEMQEKGVLSEDEPFFASGFLRENAKNLFDSEFDLLGPARGRLYRICKRHDLPGGPLWQLGLREILLGHNNGDLAAFAYYPLPGRTVYARCVIRLKIPYRGRIGDVPFAFHEIGQFCTARAIDDLAEELIMDVDGHGHMLRRREDVLSEIMTLRAEEFRMLLASGGCDDEIRAAIR